MESHSESSDWKYLLDKLNRLHGHWNMKRRSAGTSQEKWWAAVLFGIEIGCDRIWEEIANRRADLGAVIGKWERIGKVENSGPATESLQGIDYGISLVMKAVHEYLDRPPHRKPAASATHRTKTQAAAESRNSPHGQKRKRRREA